MSSSKPAVARVYTELGGWGLPTVDADGLAAIALLRFVDIPFTITSGASRSLTPSNTLPVVIFDHSSSDRQSVCAGLPSLIAFLTADLSLPDPNKHLTPFMVAESTAFAALVTSRFGPARLHELFCDDRNYADIYHVLLEKERPFPLSRILPFIRRREIQWDLRSLSADALHFNAGIALTALSTRLGERNKFFYGDQPSVLDAIVFGYLASVLYIPLPSYELRLQIANFGNLVAFVNRIKQTYFETADGTRIDGELDANVIINERRERAQQQSREATGGDPAHKDDADSEEEKERKRWNNYFIWGSVAAFAMHVLLGSEVELELE